jgi:FolB domain-containing protein
MASTSHRSKSCATPTKDVVFLRNLALHIPIGPDAWHREGKPQPVLLSIRIAYDVAQAAATDDVSKTLDYGKLSKSITALCTNSKSQFSAVGGFAQALIDLVLHDLVDKTTVQIDLDILLPKAVLRAQGGLRYKKREAWPGDSGDCDIGVLSVEGVHCACIIGVNAHERREKQTIMLDWRALGDGRDRAAEFYQDATRVIIEVRIFFYSVAPSTRAVSKE